METDPESSGYPRKRRQTRRRLLRAGMELLAERGTMGVTAGSVASTAGVATGTFYNHFTSVDDFLDAITHDLAHGVEIGRDTLTAIEHDPAVRVTIGVLQLLVMADTDPVSASAFVNLVATRADFRARVRTIVAETIADGVEAGRFDASADQATTNGVLGTTLQSMRSRFLGETTHDIAPDVARLVMRLLGVPSRSIPGIVERARRTLDAAPIAPAAV